MMLRSDSQPTVMVLGGISDKMIKQLKYIQERAFKYRLNVPPFLTAATMIPSP